MKKIFFCIMASFALLSFFGCAESKKEKEAQKSRYIAEEKESEKKKEDFPALLEKLKTKNPFHKKHEGIYKIKFVPGTLTLSGIFFDKKKPLAIINDVIVGEGDIFEDKQVFKITPREVILKDKEKEIHLRQE